MKFSHAGVVVVINEEPYVIEVAYPGVYMTKFSERIQGDNGSRFYIRQRTTPLSEKALARIPRVIDRARQFRYVHDLLPCAWANKSTTVENMCDYIEKNKECVCNMFCVWFLRNIRALSFKANTTDCYDLTWLSDMKGYGEIKRMRFFEGDVLLQLKHYPQFILEGINPFSRPTPSDSTLLLASKV